MRASVSMRIWPFRTAGSLTSQRRNRRFVVEPEDDGLVERLGQAIEGGPRDPGRAR